MFHFLTALRPSSISCHLQTLSLRVFWPHSFWFLFFRPLFFCSVSDVSSFLYFSARTKGFPQKGYPRSGQFLRKSLRNYCRKCPKNEEVWPFHGHPFCGYPFWSCPIKFLRVHHVVTLLSFCVSPLLLSFSLPRPRYNFVVVGKLKLGPLFLPALGICIGMTNMKKDQEQKSSPKSKFWGRISRGCPRGYPGGHPGAKTSVKLKILEKQAFRRGRPWPEGADVHDPRGVQVNFGQKYFGLSFRSLKENRKNGSRSHRHRWIFRCLFCRYVCLLGPSCWKCYENRGFQ